MRLHKVEGRNKFCGPAALAAISGMTTDEAAAILRDVTGKRSIHGVHWFALNTAIQRAGYRTIVHEYGRKPTLAAWLRNDREMDALYIVNVTGHYVAVSGRKIVDNQNREPVFAGKWPHRRVRVKRAIKVMA